MKNNLILIFFLLCTACASVNFVKKNELKFSDLAYLRLGVTSKPEALRQFGTPDENGQDLTNSDCEWVLYKGEEGYQRMKLYFLKSSGKLESILWTPRENELEAKTSGIFQKYGKDKFKKETLPQAHPHMVMPRYIFKSDDLGISVLNERRDDVEAIAFFANAGRAPAVK